MNSATIQVSVTDQTGQDVLSAVTTGTGITAVFNAASGTLTLSGVDTIANYDAVLNTVSYKTNSASASSSTRTLTFIVNDDGITYEKNLGPDTAARAAEIKEFDPDKSWKIAQ